MTPAQEHEEHVARVLDTPRQHHSEATDALVVEALAEALSALTDPLCGKRRCYKCAAKAKVEAALKALGK